MKDSMIKSEITTNNNYLQLLLIVLLIYIYIYMYLIWWYHLQTDNIFHSFSLVPFLRSTFKYLICPVSPKDQYDFVDLKLPLIGLTFS